MTNDGNAILREVRWTCYYLWGGVVITGEKGGRVITSEVNLCPWQQIQVQHPAAKSMIEISRTQDEEVGDGTTSVIILGEYRKRR